MLRIDLNADLGEGMANDAEIFPLITSANIAGGGHAGGGSILERSIRLAKEHAVSVGAHPSYPDRDGFGRTSMWRVLSRNELIPNIVAQVIAVAEAAHHEGLRLNHVKAHGALYNDAASSSEIADFYIECVEAAKSALQYEALPLMGLAGSVVEERCAAASIPFVAEAFADRAYTSAKQLVARSEAGSVLHDPQVVADRVIRLVSSNSMETIDGATIEIDAQSICVHGDTAEAVQLLKRVRSELTDQGVHILPFWMR